MRQTDICQVRPVAEVEYNGRSMLVSVNLYLFLNHLSKYYLKVSSNQPGIQFYTGNFLPRSSVSYFLDALLASLDCFFDALLASLDFFTCATSISWCQVVSDWEWLILFHLSIYKCFRFFLWNRCTYLFFIVFICKREGLVGKSGASYSQHGALCLETQV